MSSSIVPFLLVVCGATASGKSGLAIALAQHLSAQGRNSVIISADSRQVYREFSIGTAKPNAFEQSQVPHYLVDVCDPTETLTVADFQSRANQIIQDGHGQSPAVIPILAGGTGLYIKSIVRGMKIPRVPPHPELRRQLERLGQKSCYAMLEQVDPIATVKIHPNDRVRTLRALEVFYVTGIPMTDQQGERPPRYPILQIGLDTPEIDARIAHRTAQMFEQGFVAEVQMLMAKYGETLALLNTLGYAEVRQYLRGEISETEAQRLTVLHTRQFAKRQRTWFRGTPEIEWFDSNAVDLVARVVDRVDRFMLQYQAGLPEV
ncbi:tRNA (adenosine(37)-N6)-dimethylallyltransferase MiaA [Romeriopsis navalis]|uniref:tRNA (adenosine(37)-N6)-dimethylallyltransferase MiaA n=1 Tax=Romeriopsis navalis TaxID=2992132 RepID=UPI0021F8D774|nr:tRNA (adenosine(37)-N6)-dimethylallyltransferase MiaA [Romeriopsis navalis]